MSNPKLTEEVLSLPLLDRVELAEALWQSIAEGPSSGGAEEREAVELAKKRAQDLATGGAVGRSHEQVMEAARRALK
jgi:putative addiction module component (TIGR02574 family)